MFNVRFHSKSFLLCLSSFTSKITFTSKVLLVKLNSEIKQPSHGMRDFFPHTIVFLVRLDSFIASHIKIQRGSTPFSAFLYISLYKMCELN